MPLTDSRCGTSWLEITRVGAGSSPFRNSVASSNRDSV
jgi:hypothetical protein